MTSPVPRALHSFPTRRSSDLPREILQVFTKLNLMGEPRVRHRLVIQVIGPLITDRLQQQTLDRKSTRLNSSHVAISYAVFCLKKKTLAKRPPEMAATTCTCRA